MRKVVVLSAILAVLTWRSEDVQMGADYLVRALGPLIH